MDNKNSNDVVVETLNRHVDRRLFAEEAAQELWAHLHDIRIASGLLPAPMLNAVDDVLARYAAFKPK